MSSLWSLAKETAAKAVTATKEAGSAALVATKAASAKAVAASVNAVENVAEATRRKLWWWCWWRGVENKGKERTGEERGEGV